MDKSSPGSLVISGPGVSDDTDGGGAVVLDTTVTSPGENEEVPSVVIKVGVIGVVWSSLSIGVDVFLKSSEEIVNNGTHWLVKGSGMELI